MSRYDISVDAASRLLALSHVNDLLSHSQVQHDKLRIELKLQTSKAAARMCEASFWVARLESGWSGQCAGEHSAVSVRPARQDPRLRRARMRRHWRPRPSRRGPRLRQANRGHRRPRCPRHVQVGVGPLLLTVGLHVGHWRRARGPGSGELRGLSAREDVGGSKAGATSPVVTGD